MLLALLGTLPLTLLIVRESRRLRLRLSASEAAFRWHGWRLVGLVAILDQQPPDHRPMPTQRPILRFVRDAPAGRFAARVQHPTAHGGHDDPGPDRLGVSGAALPR